MDYPVTQYLYPDGSTRQLTVDLPEEAHNTAVEIEAVLSAEVLSTGVVAVYCRRKGEEEEDEWIELCENDPKKDNALQATIKAIEAVKERGLIIHSTGG